jgi:hypothetical protein
MSVVPIAYASQATTFTTDGTSKAGQQNKPFSVGWVIGMMFSLHLTVS